MRRVVKTGSAIHPSIVASGDTHHNDDIDISETSKSAKLNWRQNNSGARMGLGTKSIRSAFTWPSKTG